MSTEIIVALVAAVGTAAGSLGGILISNRLATYRIGKLEEKVDRHNRVIERVYKLEESAASAHKRIDELHVDIDKIRV